MNQGKKPGKGELGVHLQEEGENKHVVAGFFCVSSAVSDKTISRCSYHLGNRSPRQKVTPSLYHTHSVSFDERGKDTSSGASQDSAWL